MKVFIDRSGPLRSADGLRRGQHAAARRHEPAHLPHARRRQDVDGDRHRHPRRRAGQRRPRGSEAQGAALRRLRDPGLRLVRRRRSLAVAAAEHGGVVGARSDRSKTTTSSSARTAAASGSSTTSRRCGRSTRRRRSRTSCSSSRRPRCACAGTRTPTRRCRPTSRGAESARGRDHRLLPEVRGVGSGHAGDPRRRRQAGAPLLERPTRCSRPDPATITIPLVLVSGRR